MFSRNNGPVPSCGDEWPRVSTDPFSVVRTKDRRVHDVELMKSKRIDLKRFLTFYAGDICATVFVKA